VGETLPTYNTVTNITVEDRQWAATHQTHGKPPVGEILPTHSTVTNITVEDTGSVPMELTLPVTLPRDPQGGNGELFPRLPNNDRFEDSVSQMNDSQMNDSESARDPPKEESPANVKVGDITQQMRQKVFRNSGWESTTIESFLNHVHVVRDMSSVVNSGALSNQTGVSRQATEKILLMSAFLDCPRAFLLYHNTGEEGTEQGPLLLHENSLSTLSDEEIKTGTIQLQLRDVHSGKEEGDMMSHLPEIRFGLRRAIFYVVAEAVEALNNTADIRQHAEELFGIDWDLRLAACPREGTKEKYGYLLLSMFASQSFRNKDKKVSSAIVNKDLKPTTLKSEWEDEFWTREKCLNRVLKRVHVARNLLRRPLQKKRGNPKVWTRPSMDEAWQQVEARQEDELYIHGNKCVADLHRRIMLGSDPSGEGPDSWCRFLRDKLAGAKSIDDLLDVTQPFFSTGVVEGLCTREEVAQWTKELEDSDTRPEVSITLVPIRQQVGEGFEHLSESTAPLTTVNSYVVVVDNLYSRGVRILLNRWVNSGKRKYVRRQKGPLQNGQPEFSNSYIRGAVHPTFRVPSEKLVNPKRGKSIPVTPDIVLGRGPTAVRYESTNKIDPADSLVFVTTQLMRNLERDFCTEQYLITLFTHPDDLLKYEVLGVPVSQHFGPHNDANRAVTREDHKEAQIDGRGLPSKFEMRTISVAMSNCTVPSLLWWRKIWSQPKRRRPWGRRYFDGHPPPDLAGAWITRSTRLVTIRGVAPHTAMVIFPQPNPTRLYKTPALPLLVHRVSRRNNLLRQ